jgi:hypothetical protein
MIYILRHDEFFGTARLSYIKVGASSEVEKRRRQLQVGNPRPLHVYWQGHGGRKEEAILKKKLRPYRSPGGGEWFYLNERTEAILREHLVNYRYPKG